jgi:hypothetical protein
MGTKTRAPKRRGRSESPGKELEPKLVSEAIETLARAVDAIAGPEASFAEREAALYAVVREAACRADGKSGK